MVEQRKVVWSADAWKQLKEAFKYISKDSIINATKVRNDIVEITRKIPANPYVQIPTYIHRTNTRQIMMVLFARLKNTGTGLLTG